jgi:hypothetical protein
MKQLDSFLSVLSISSEVPLMSFIHTFLTIREFLELLVLSLRKGRSNARMKVIYLEHESTPLTGTGSQLQCSA